MENLSYIGLSSQLAIQQQMNMTANNIANMSTPGYKSQKALFADYLTRPTDRGGINQVENASSYRDLSSGPLQQTSNPLDLAISGPGYFTVQTADGNKYTRDGSFTLNAARELVDRSGNKVMGESGPITVPAEATSIKISPEGEVSTNEGTIGRLKVVDVENPQGMQRGGDNLLSMKGAREKPVANLHIVQGMVEGSNVNPIIEMNRMIELLRSFQSAQKMVQNDHDRIRGMIEKLTKV